MTDDEKLPWNPAALLIPPIPPDAVNSHEIFRVMRLHRMGCTPATIAERLKMPRERVEKIYAVLAMPSHTDDAPMERPVYTRPEEEQGLQPLGEPVRKYKRPPEGGR